ncbi:bifunctional adenosylcobinamide kinase/adenosylcobinamide-phosphate guanylyltransferase [Vibrio hangzhouensis]|uniref:Bifunctional adenosylcobalamin biosynthesis protein n=1 Tax=Vibrio hangzhouensis TaxID=462991 RepID=A0A1H5VV54_9VIBR|nr:bifunctional adenosylcobinamide kinase/adenosylcobinamide-phosphate guanylyltransferase [Vibrio hangzhouensis]SEF91100.1 adenosylcobinamide kinase /adenosylcobinamide-phosphate guanylyltransferase [Vibrio hangzhouensis]
MSVELILGGARSGKSHHAELRVAELLNLDKRTVKHYVATSEPLDDEMRQRIEHHRQQRGAGWTEWECPLSLAELVTRFQPEDIVLIDCLTLWLNNQIFYQGEACSNATLEREIERLIVALERCPAQVILVSNEVGLGVVPMGQVSRLFVDNAGRMNQRVAVIADKVVFVAAGLPMLLKQAKT